ncbi:hypothetical protein FOXG_21693 [Fusarium oxysporum f. sp. lycopersici 4287]|uniref:Uncharacterized protein n=2 Tax=Fusarium oxysporum f. sp. lycopersici (strain 4287 / CBS 123668 / FGSC 9935 / NRRL 34936) TaxID=426428 RepID=A0A0J9W124_FUSO4|nr:hypothetical protein FOXG_21693 [Fusarium oxysporum f. sp. lycopersici 4287]KAJ9413281.1 hypothetical protein QL093DRAFT_2123372 [Fusarium oxysporum]KNB16525.1 hypothetical protein FOXG_21693 [Fusarium oxysporum f. sp. lycopersici 4287]
MLERRSLHCLESIARSESLGQSVEELDICTSHLLPLDEVEAIERPHSEYESMMKHLKKKNDIDAILHLGIEDFEEGVGDEDEQDVDNDQDNQAMDSGIGDDDKAARSRLEQINTQEYNRHLHDQDDMMRAGYDVKCLAGAMTHLKSCRKINISTSIHACGLRRLRQRIGILPQRGLTFKSKASIRQVHHIVQVVLAAIAVSRISVQHLDIKPSMMLENANRISPFMLMGPSSSIILSKSFPTSLRQLQISLDPESPPEDTISGRKWGTGLLQFVHLLPELSDLELSFEYRDEAGRFSEIAKDLYIPKLESVTFHLVDTTKEDITILLLCHHRTLRTVVLESIQLDGDLTAWRWLIEVVWRSLELDEFCILSSWAERKDEDFPFAKLEDITIVDNDSYNDAVRGLI